MTQDTNRQDILETARAEEILTNWIGETYCDPNHPTAVYIAIASRIAGGLAINYVGQPTQGSKREFARTVIELTNALCAEIGDRTLNLEDITNKE